MHVCHNKYVWIILKDMSSLNQIQIKSIFERIKDNEFILKALHFAISRGFSTTN